MIKDNKEDFDVFKSNVCHNLQTLGDIAFIHSTISAKEIEQYFIADKHAESLYLLAMVDYLCRLHNITPPKQYEKLHQLKLPKPLYPKSMLFLANLSDDATLLNNKLSQAIPEFTRFNIIEGDIRNVI